MVILIGATPTHHRANPNGIAHSAFVLILVLLIPILPTSTFFPPPLCPIRKFVNLVNLISLSRLFYLGSILLVFIILQMYREMLLLDLNSLQGMILLVI